MIINHNLPSMNTDRQLGINNFNTAKSLEKLSSGLRINRAGDDAAGLAISEKMRAQVRGLDQASRNSQDGISLIQTAEGALGETHSILQRMRELAVQSATDTNTGSDRSEMQKEVDQLATEISRISNTTEFNTKNLLAGGLSSTFHIGANAGQSISLSVNAMDAFSLGVAGSTVASGGFAAGATGITGVSNAGRGLATGTGYNIEVNQTAAGLSVPIAKTAGTGDAVAADATLTDVTAYTGRDAAAYQVHVTATDGDDVTEIRYSTDGGTSWQISAGAGTFSIGNGLTFNTATNAGGYDTNTEFAFTVSPETSVIKLVDTDDATQIGSTVTARYGDTSAVVGDVANNKTVQVNFNFTSLSDGSIAGTNQATFNAVASASTAATVVNDVVTVGADTKAGIAINTQSAANSAITTINTAITTVSTERAKLGAMQNRLEHTIANLGTSSENLTAAESRVRDVDMAKEMMQFQKNNILSQAATAMLAQANQQPQGVLQLLR